MSSAYQVLNSPVVTVAIGVVLTTATAVAAAVIGLFVRVSAMAETIKGIAGDVKAIADDKDVMRWSQWAPSHDHSSQNATAGEAKK